MRQVTRVTSKLGAIICATLLAAAVLASAKEGETRKCETKLGGQVVCGDLVIGITLEQYEAGLKKRAEEIRAEEAEKRIQLQKLVELTERATSAEKEILRGQIAAIEAEKHESPPACPSCGTLQFSARRHRASRIDPWTVLRDQ